MEQFLTELEPRTIDHGFDVVRQTMPFDVDHVFDHVIVRQTVFDVDHGYDVGLTSAYNVYVSLLCDSERVHDFICLSLEVSNQTSDSIASGAHKRWFFLVNFIRREHIP